MPSTTEPVRATVHVDTTAPVGLATKAGLAGAVGQFTAAVVLLTQDQSTESIALLISSGLTLLTVLGGRYAQAVAYARAIAAAVREASR